MKSFLENSNLEELELIQKYMDEKGIDDPEKLTSKDYELIEESTKIDQHKLESDLKNTFTHMLKYKYQATEQKKGWMSTISRGCITASKFVEDKSNINKLNSKITEEEFITKVYNSALKDKSLYSDTGMKLEDFPKTAKEAFGSCRELKHLSDWKYMNDHFIVPNAIHDSKEKMESDWSYYKW